MSLQINVLIIVINREIVFFGKMITKTSRTK